MIPRPGRLRLDWLTGLLRTKRQGEGQLCGSALTLLHEHFEDPILSHAPEGAQPVHARVHELIDGAIVDVGDAEKPMPKTSIVAVRSHQQVTVIKEVRGCLQNQPCLAGPTRAAESE
jgi:hypothetical protein